MNSFSLFGLPSSCPSPFPLPTSPSPLLPTFPSPFPLPTSLSPLLPTFPSPLLPTSPSPLLLLSLLLPSLPSFPLSLPNRMVIRWIIGEIEKQLEQPDIDSQKEGEAESKKST